MTHAGNIERLQRRFCEIKLADADAKTGAFSGYGAFFGNEDSYGDVIAHGAFAATLREWKARRKLPPMLLQHGGGPFGSNANDMLPIGQWLSMEENSEGLKVEGRLFAMQTERGQYIYEGLKSGVLDGLSIGYMTREARMGTKPDEPTRTLTDIDLVEVSVVLNPANTLARVSAVKALTVDEIRELEDSLRDEGLSWRDAKKACSVFRRLQRDVADPVTAPRDVGASEQAADHQAIEAIASASRHLDSMLSGSLKF